MAKVPLYLHYATLDCSSWGLIATLHLTLRTLELQFLWPRTAAVGPGQFQLSHYWLRAHHELKIYHWNVVFCILCFIYAIQCCRIPRNVGTSVWFRRLYGSMWLLLLTTIPLFLDQYYHRGLDFHFDTTGTIDPRVEDVVSRALILVQLIIQTLLLIECHMLLVNVENHQVVLPHTSTL